MVKWSERKAREKKREDFADTPKKGRKVAKPVIKDPKQMDEVYKTTAHQKKRDEAIAEYKKGRRG